jgi:hypothetical protein
MFNNIENNIIKAIINNDIELIKNIIKCNVKYSPGIKVLRYAIYYACCTLNTGCLYFICNYHLTNLDSIDKVGCNII